MSVCIAFHGVCLFLPDPDSFDVLVYLPNCSSRANLPHLDGMPAMSHFAWLTVSGEGSVELKGTEILVTGANGAPKADLKDVFLCDIAQFTDRRIRPLDVRDPINQDRVAARMRLTGGSMTAVNPIGGEDDVYWSMSSEVLRPNYRYRLTRLSRGLLWESGLDEVVLSLTSDGNAQQITLKGGDERFPAAVIMNLPWPEPPDSHAMHAHRGREPGERIFDDDFKWLYRLFEPTGEPWSKLVTPITQLPVPVRRYLKAEDYHFLGGYIPSTGDCIGGTYLEPGQV
jgi:hypothetical protein